MSGVVFGIGGALVLFEGCFGMRIGVIIGRCMNVYILGVPTSGKSTLARMLKTEKPEFNVISFEAVRNGFLRVQPGLDMGNRESVARREVLPKFIVEFADWNANMTGNPTLVEGSFARVEEVMRLVRKNDTVICLGYGEKSLEEIARQAIREAGPKSYLYGRTEEEFIEHFYDLAEDDRSNREFCRENMVPYFGTVENREATLKEVVELVKALQVR